MILKRKSRYVLIESSDSIDMGAASNWNDFKSRIGEFMGIAGISAANPKFVKQSGNFFVVRVNRGSEDLFVAATAFVRQLRGEKIGFYTLCTSGTIAALARKYEVAHANESAGTAKDI